MKIYSIFFFKKVSTHTFKSSIHSYLLVARCILVEARGFVANLGRLILDSGVWALGHGSCIGAFDIEGVWQS
jgi:hypothetical protein